MRLAFVLFGAALALGAIAPQAQAADDFKDLLSRVPDSANAIVLIDVEGLIKSPRAIKERWASKHASEYLSGAMMVPPTASKAVLASRLGTGEDWVVGIIPTKRDVPMKEIAKDERSEVETIADTAAVHTKRNAYFVELGPKLLGVMSPANRQEVGRWIRTAKRTREAGLSKYLMDAADWPRNGQILIAIDMQDMFDPKAVRNWLTHCKQLEGKRGDIDKAAKLLGNLRGVKFMARVSDTIKGELYLDFSTNLDPMDIPLMKPVLIAGLEEIGASVEEVTNGKGTIEGRSLIVDAEISDKVLRRILSVIQAPAPSAGHIAETSAPSNEDPALYASRRYYQSVQSLVNELKDMAQRTSYSTGLVIKWYETYARKIDQLPLVDVDAELLQYGSSVANKLRQVAASFQGHNIQTTLIQSYKRTNTYVSGGGVYGNAYTGYGYAGASVWRESNAADVYTAKATVAAQGATDRNKLWQSIDEDTAEVRKEMALKFKADF